jgi:hypothetical protein
LDKNTAWGCWEINVYVSKQNGGLMDVTKVIIENWPNTNILLQSIPIIIAVIALGISLYTIHLTRKSFIASHRPYVWGGNYGVIDLDKKTISPIPHRVIYRVKNAPAKILESKVKITLNGESLLNHKNINFVRFPDEKSEWNFGIGEAKYKQIMNRSVENQANLLRHISIKYSLLGGGEKYKYTLEQSFVPADNQWKDKTEQAN